MSVTKSTNRSAGKAPSANGKAAAKKVMKASAVRASSRPKRKRAKSSAASPSLKARQMTVERLKRLIWSSLQPITEAMIKHASTGNLAAMKELFNFAGVYSLPEPDDENAAAAAVSAAGEPPEPAADPALVHPIDLFFKKIGVEPSTAQPESGAA